MTIKIILSYRYACNIAKNNNIVILPSPKLFMCKSWNCKLIIYYTFFSVTVWMYIIFVAGMSLPYQCKSYAVETWIEHCSLVCLIGTGTMQGYCVMFLPYHCIRSGSHELIGMATCTLREITTDRYCKSKCIIQHIYAWRLVAINLLA